MPLIESRPTSPARIGRAALTAVFIAVPVLMFVPSLMTSWDYQSIDVGDEVRGRGQFQGIRGNAFVEKVGDKTYDVPMDFHAGRVTRIEGGMATVSSRSKVFSLPVEVLEEL